MIAENRILWLPDTDQRMWDEDASNRSASGIRITPENALSVSVVYACIRVLAESVAALPLHILERVEGKGKRKAVELPLYRKLYLQPNSWQTSFEWRCQLMLHLGLYNVAYCEIVAGPAGAVDSLEPLHPSRMKVERIENGRLRYKYREQSGQETVYTHDQILAIRGMSEDGINGLSPVETCKDAIALARACEIHGSKFFANGARPGFVLSTDTQLNPEARENIRSQWDRRHGGVGNAFQTAVLTGGLKPYEIPQSSNSDAQFLELRKFQIEEICRLYRVPQQKVQSMQGQSYGSLEQVSQDFLTDTIVPWLRRFESAFLRDLIVEDDRYEVSFDTRAMLRADAASRTSMYTSLWNLGVYNTNDIRESEGLNAVEGGDIRYRPLNMGVLGQEAAPADAAAQQQPGSAIDGQAVAPAAAAPAEAAAGPQVADVSLNGAQINGLIAILSQVPAGLLSKDGAGALILASFPSIPPASVAAILNGVSTTPLPVEPPKAAPAQRAYCAGGKGAGIDPSCSGQGNVSADSGGAGGDGSSHEASTAWRESLPKEQAKAVDGWMYQDYEAIRENQNTQDKYPERYVRDKLDKDMFDATENWNEAMESAPVYEGVAYRGINPYTNTKGFSPDDYTVGDVITFSADSSATSDPVVAKRFSELPTQIDYEDQGYGTTFEPKPGVVLKIHTTTAADIRGANPKEKEVIIRRRSKYVVDSINGNEVTLKEE